MADILFEWTSNEESQCDLNSYQQKVVSVRIIRHPRFAIRCVF